MSSSPRSIPTADRISSLPDSVLSHILSFLSTKLAVATSVLSKRWTPLWLSVTTLDVDEENFKHSASFRLFIYSVIVSRDPTLPLESFRIRCRKSSKFNPFDLNRFVLAALKRGVRNFDLHLHVRRPKLDHVKKLSLTIFQVLSCKTLVVLKLNNLGVIDVPHLVNLPLLKTLHLASIDFLEYMHLMNIFMGCPILEDLHINNVRFEHAWGDSKEEFEFEGFPNLVRANIRDSNLPLPFAWFYNLKFMCVDVGEMSMDESPFPTFHNLTHIELIFYCEWTEKWVIQVLQHCPKLQNLIFVQTNYYEEPIEVEDWKDPETVPDCLLYQLRACSLKGFKGNQFELQFAEYIMLNSKILCTMAIESKFVDEKTNYQMLKKLSSYPRGSLTCKLLFD